MSSGQNKKVNSIAKKLSRFVRRKKLSLYTFTNLLLVVACLTVYILSMEYAECGYLSAGDARIIEINHDAWAQFKDGRRAITNNRDIGGIAGTGLGRAVVGAGAVVDYYLRNYEKLDNVLVYRKCINVSNPDPNKYKIIASNDMYSTIVEFELPILMEIFAGLLVLIVLKLVQRLFSLISIGFEKRRIRRILRPIDEVAARADELTRLEFDETKYHNLEERIAGLEPDDSLPVTEGDGELESLENAINNLLMRMRESNRQQARFVNDASHELRTPIAVIEGYANMLARWGREDEKVLDESIQAIRHESAHMKYLVEQLLFLARGDSGKTVLKPEDISLTDMMREIYEESLMIDENHVYRFNCAEDEDIHLTCDPTLIKQAVRILVDNAAKYTKEKDEIILSVGNDAEGHPYLQVQDTGIGMAESDVSHMFERFYRSDEVRSFKGTGLGLSIAKWIIDKHSGHFEVTSREGIGTRIRVVL